MMVRTRRPPHTLRAHRKTGRQRPCEGGNNDCLLSCHLVHHAGSTSYASRSAAAGMERRPVVARHVSPSRPPAYQNPNVLPPSSRGGDEVLDPPAVHATRFNQRNSSWLPTENDCPATKLHFGRPGCPPGPRGCWCRVQNASPGRVRVRLGGQRGRRRQGERPRRQCFRRTGADVALRLAAPSPPLAPPWPPPGQSSKKVEHARRSPAKGLSTNPNNQDRKDRRDSREQGTGTANDAGLASSSTAAAALAGASPPWWGGRGAASLAGPRDERVSFPRFHRC